MYADLDYHIRKLFSSLWKHITRKHIIYGRGKQPIDQGLEALVLRGRKPVVLR